MAIAKVVYKENASATPEVWMDTTQKTVTAGTMLSGTTALKNDGTGITGNIASKSSSDLTASGATVTAPAGYYPNAASKAVASGSASTPATSITANPTISVNASGLITASVSGSKSVTPTVSAGYVSSGTAGTVSVSGSNTEQLSTQAGTTITPTESEQTAVASGKFTTGAVKVVAISSTYVGSGITQRDSTDLTASGATVTAPAGYYAEAASTSVASGTAGTPTATKGTVSNHSVSVTPSVTNTTGYITGGTKTGNAVSVSASELVSGTKTITASGTTDVTNYASVSVAAGTAGTPTATKGTVSNHSISITPSVTNTTGYITGGTKNGTAVTVNVAELESGTKTITENGTGISVSGYSAVDVDVPGQEPTGVKYVYTDVDGVGAWDVSGYQYLSYDFAPVRDNKTRVWVDIPSDDLLITIKVATWSTTGLINWGDGVQDTWDASDKTKTHSYSSGGRYVIEVYPVSGQMYFDLDDFAFGQTTSVADTKVIAAEDYHAVYTTIRSSYQNCTNLRKITSYGAAVSIVASDAFKDCVSLQEVHLPETITKINSSSFENCSSLSSATIPQNVTTIRAAVFRNCSSLHEVHMKSETPPSISALTGSSGVFYGCPSEMVIFVPYSSDHSILTNYQNATNWSEFASKMQEEPL